MAATIDSASARVHHHRRDDAHGAAIEDHLDVFVLPGRDPGQRDAAGVGDRPEHVGRRLNVGVGVLHVDGEPRKARPRHESRRRDAAQAQPGPDLRFPGLQRPFDWILFQREFLAVIAGNSHLVPESVRRSNESRKSRPGEQVSEPDRAVSSKSTNMRASLRAYVARQAGFPNTFDFGRFKRSAFRRPMSPIAPRSEGHVRRSRGEGRSIAERSTTLWL